jgi:hypothetical protein
MGRGSEQSCRLASVAGSHYAAPQFSAKNRVFSLEDASPEKRSMKPAGLTEPA